MTTDQPQPFPALDIGDVQTGLGQDLLCVVDTRAAFDYAGGRIPGSINLPGSSMRSRKGQVPQGRQVVILADDDEHALAGCELARGLGFVVAGYVSGGFDVWAEAGYPVATISDGMGMPAPGLPDKTP